MFNLLPDNLKNKIRSEYKTRRAVVALLFLILIQVSIIVFMIPSWLISLYKENGLMLQLEKSNQSALSSDANEIKGKIKLINNEIGLLDTALEYPELSPFVDYVLSKKSSSIKIDSFNYVGGKTWILTIEGISASREALVSFVDNLKEGGVFKTVDLPVSNLAKNKNIDFSIIMTIAK